MMRMFLTSASGFIGSRILLALQASDHQVIGLTCSDAAAQTLKALGVEVYRGTLDASNSLLADVEGANAVIHTAFDHDFSRFTANCEKGRQAILTTGWALQGSAWPLVITSDALMSDDGSGIPTQESFFNSEYPSPCTASELTGQQLLETGVDIRMVHLPQVHDTVRQGLLTSCVERVVANGAVALCSEGGNRWSTAHVNDVAQLYASALLQSVVGKRYHMVAEGGIVLCDTAAVITRGLNLPLTHPDESQVDAWSGWSAPFIALDLYANSAWAHE